MKKINFIGIGILSLVLITALPTVPYAKSFNAGLLNLPDSVITQCKTHDIGNLEYTISNWGMYGYCTGAPGAEWPAGSGVEHLFGGGLWIGAILNDDTIVSTGVEGWTVADETGSDFYELFPGDTPGDTIEEVQVISDQDYIAIYSDTVGFPHAPIHTPLEIEIRQHSYTWSDTIYDDFVIFDYTITNIGVIPLEKVFVGIFLDPDIGDTGILNFHVDDLTGFIDTLSTGDTVNIAWARDDDGDGGQSPGVIGIRLLCEERMQIGYIAYNWWRSNMDCDLDYGPYNPNNQNDQKLLQIQRRQCPSDNNPGTPLDDIAKFLLMSNFEIDCDQEDCPPPNPYSPPAADDIRFLFSFGPVENIPGGDLPPGDSVQFTFAVGVGDDLDDLADNLLRSEDLCGVVGVEEERSEFVFRNGEFGLRQNKPNPFDKLTAISYQLRAPSHTTLQIFDIAGRLVKTLVDERQEPGAYQVEWDGRGHTSGIYFLRYSTGDYTSTKKMTLIR
jgi:hypothetical protein